MLFATNVADVVDSMATRALLLSDIWGYVPGSGPGDGRRWRDGVWQQFVPPASVLDHMKHALGPRWLGMDIGEQDGRYIGGFAAQVRPFIGCRVTWLSADAPAIPMMTAGPNRMPTWTMPIHDRR